MKKPEINYSVKDEVFNRIQNICGPKAAFAAQGSHSETISNETFINLRKTEIKSIQNIEIAE